MHDENASLSEVFTANEQFYSFHLIISIFFF